MNEKGLSAPNKKKWEWLKKDENIIEWLEFVIKIPDKEGNIIPFRLTKQQKEFLQNKKKSNFLLKSRQCGFSVLICSMALRRAILYPNSSCMLVSMDLKSTSEVFSKLKIMYQNLDKWIKPKTINNNKQELKFDNNSKITCVTAGTADCGRGSTNQLIHCSEFAFWRDPERHLNSLQKSLTADSILILETTANGLNYAQQLYTKAKNKENDFQAFFFDWINCELFDKDYELAAERWKARNGKYLTVDELDGEEMNLYKNMKATLKMLMFRRLEIENSSLDKFHTERPSNDLEAFLNTGSSIFSAEKINQKEMYLMSKKEKFIPKHKLKDLPDLLKNHYGKSLFIYELPEKYTKDSYVDYFAGVDCSMGIKRDYGTCVIFDQYGVETAMFRNNAMAPHVFTQVIFELGVYFNKATLGVEKASAGIAVIEKLRELGYVRLAKFRGIDTHGKKKRTYGFDTKMENKRRILNKLREEFDTDKIHINSMELLNEMKTYEVKDDNSMGAAGSFFDDLVMAAAIARETQRTAAILRWE